MYYIASEPYHWIIAHANSSIFVYLYTRIPAKNECQFFWEKSRLDIIQQPAPISLHWKFLNKTNQFLKKTNHNNSDKFKLTSPEFQRRLSLLIIKAVKKKIKNKFFTRWWFQILHPRKIYQNNSNWIQRLSGF